MIENKYRKMRNKIKNNIKNLIDFQVDQFSSEFEEGMVRIAVCSILGDLLEENDKWLSSRNYFGAGEECE